VAVYSKFRERPGLLPLRAYIFFIFGRYNLDANLFSGARVVEIEYFVVPDGATWKVRIDNQDSTPYDTLQEAIKAAMDAARGARKCGFSTNVLVLQAQGGWASVEGRAAVAEHQSDAKAFAWT
jgi:hypothetical protein